MKQIIILVLIGYFCLAGKALADAKRVIPVIVNYLLDSGSCCQGPDDPPPPPPPEGPVEEEEDNGSGGLDDGDGGSPELTMVVDTVDVGPLSKTRILLPGSHKNANEHALFVHYLGTGKSLDGNRKQSVPFRSYFASCGVDTENPRMFVSLTMDDDSPNANVKNPRFGSIMETKYDPDTGYLLPTDNQQILPFCNEVHGVAVSPDCNTVSLLCATAQEEKTSQSYTGQFRDLVEEGGLGGEVISSDNVAQINARTNLTDQQRQDSYEYNGEMWLLEWDQGKLLDEAPDKYVIHKAYGGGHPMGASSLVFSEQDNSYAASLVTSSFGGDGRRHRSAALMIVEREPWQLNANDRGWDWACAYGHVFFIRAFWNPYKQDDRNGEYGALCTSDGNNLRAGTSGTVGIKYESSDFFEGFTNYLLASHNSGVSNGGAHIVMPVDENRMIGVLTAAEAEPWHDTTFVNLVETTEQSAINFYGAQGAADRGLSGLSACEWYFGDGNSCLTEFLYENRGFSLFNWGFWSKNQIEPRDLSKIGIFHTDQNGRNLSQADGRMVKWVIEDDNCLLGAPQLVDLKNGRYLLGYGKFQCISDGFKLRRFATNTVNTRSEATMIPSAYYVVEIDVQGNLLTEPVQISDSGWGGVDALVNFGEGRAAWAYITSPELKSDGSFPNPIQALWELNIYTSPATN